jgi:hypothetical protein
VRFLERRDVQRRESGDVVGLCFTSLERSQISNHATDLLQRVRVENVAASV